jgi:hypothetical protein
VWVQSEFQEQKSEVIGGCKNVAIVAVACLALAPTELHLEVRRDANQAFAQVFVHCPQGSGYKKRSRSTSEGRHFHRFPPHTISQGKATL